MDIEKVAEETPQKIHTTKVDLKNEISKKDALKILEPFNLNNSQLLQGKKILDAMYQLFLKKDASLIEINPLIITKQKELICLDAKINFDDNSIFRQPDILELMDLQKIQQKLSANHIAILN